MDDKFAIIGVGFVGDAIWNGLRLRNIIPSVLIDPEKGWHGTYSDLEDVDCVFVCVPSPMNRDGSCDTSILESVIQKLNDVNFTGTIISKVTAPPMVYTRLQESNMNLVYSPEFLTAANAVDDYIKSKSIIIGGKSKMHMREAARLIRKTILYKDSVDVRFCTIEEASLTKYAINSFLATKVIFMNELKDSASILAKKCKCDFETVKNLMLLDERIGDSHMDVPGHDGEAGFGGACFPKDTLAFLKFAEAEEIDLSVLNAAVEKNRLYRA